MEKLSNQFSNETSCKFAADGVACIENAFTPKEIAIFNDVFEYLASHPTSKRIDFQGDENSKFFTDLTNFDPVYPFAAGMTRQPPNLALSVGDGVS